MQRVPATISEPIYSNHLGSGIVYATEASTEDLRSALLPGLIWGLAKGDATKDRANDGPHSRFLPTEKLSSCFPGGEGRIRGLIIWAVKH